MLWHQPNEAGAGQILVCFFETSLVGNRWIGRPHCCGGREQRTRREDYNTANAKQISSDSQAPAGDKGAEQSWIPVTPLAVTRPQCTSLALYQIRAVGRVHYLVLINYHRTSLPWLLMVAMIIILIREIGMVRQCISPSIFFIKFLHRLSLIYVTVN